MNEKSKRENYFKNINARDNKTKEECKNEGESWSSFCCPLLTSFPIFSMDVKGERNVFKSIAGNEFYITRFDILVNWTQSNYAKALQHY